MTTTRVPPRNFASNVRAEGFLYRTRRTDGMPVINKTGSSIAANKLVALSGYDVTSKRLKIVLADADVAGHADIWVTKAAIANGAKAYVYKGFISTADQNTNGVTTAGDAVYLDTTAGAFTATAPTSTNARQIIVGYAHVKSTTVGQIVWDIQPVVKLAASDTQGAGAIITYSTDGAITVAPQTALLTKGTAAAMTLAAPGTAGIGTTLTITTGSNLAHVVTFTGTTLNDGTAGANSTWTAAAVKGSSITVVGTTATEWNVVSFNLGTIAP